MNLPEGLIAVLRQPSPCFLTTLMPDGSPQMTQTWVDTDGEHVVINTVQGSPEGQERRARPAGGRERLRPVQPLPLLRDPRPGR